MLPLGELVFSGQSEALGTSQAETLATIPADAREPAVVRVVNNHATAVISWKWIAGTDMNRTAEKLIAAEIEDTINPGGVYYEANPPANARLIAISSVADVRLGVRVSYQEPPGGFAQHD